MGQVAVVFVHGLFSSGRAWSRFCALLESDADLADVACLRFEYPSPKFNFHPLRGIPDFDVLADSLQTYLETVAEDYKAIILVSHSQGGLVVQRYLARMVAAARGKELKRIQRVIMFACPNAGSAAFLLARRGLWLWRNAQERDLRPIRASVAAATQTVIDRIVYAQQVAPEQCPIEVQVYAGDQDKVVLPASAFGPFPNKGVVPGDHSSIIFPSSMQAPAYLVIKKSLLAVFVSLGETVYKESASNSSRDAEGRSRATPLQSAVTQISEAAIYPNGSSVIVRYNESAEMMEYIVTPEIAFEWMIKRGGEVASDD